MTATTLYVRSVRQLDGWGNTVEVDAEGIEPGLGDINNVRTVSYSCHAVDQPKVGAPVKVTIETGVPR